MYNKGYLSKIERKRANTKLGEMFATCITYKAPSSIFPYSIIISLYIKNTPASKYEMDKL